MIFILKTYTITSIENNVIQPYIFKKAGLLNLDRFKSHTFIINRPTWWKYNTIHKPYPNNMILALSIGNISWAITFWTYVSALRLKVFKCLIVTHFIETAFLFYL